MEKELSCALDLINKQRHEFHALNYFTTQQLLQIRRELGNLRQNKSAEVPPQLLSLLTSISLQISVNDIKNIVEEVCTLFSEQAINMTEESQIVKVQSFTNSEDKMIEDGAQIEKEMGQEEEGHSKLIQDLTGDEEEIFVQLHDLGYSEVVCYRAVKHAFTSTESTNNDDILDAAMEWCFDNGNQSDENNSINVNEEINHQHRPSEAEEVTMEEESITVSHPVVQKLLELGFTPELSLKGAKLCNGAFEQASEWCLNAETEGSKMKQHSFEGDTSILSSEEAMDTIR